MSSNVRSMLEDPQASTVMDETWAEPTEMEGAPKVKITNKEEHVPKQKGANNSSPRCLRSYSPDEEQEDNIPASSFSTTADHELKSCNVKEEPQARDNLPRTDHYTLSDHRRQMSSIKEEPCLYEGEDLPHAQSYQIKVESSSDDLDCSSPEIEVPSVHIKQEPADLPTHELCPPAEIKEEPRSPDGYNPTNTDNCPPFDPTKCLSVQIKEEKEDFPRAGLHILEGTITDSDIHSFTITGEYIEGVEVKLKTKPMQDKVASTSQLSSKTTYSCPVCKRSFTNHGNLVRHRETHKGKKMSCSECGADFCNKTDLTAHARIHKANRVLYCSECNITFPSHSHLIIHERIHTGEKPFACSHCGKCFSSKSNVAEHMKVHTGSKQFCCSVCGKSYARRENLLSHQRIHQEAATFTCAHCGQCFVDQQKFARHQRFHTLDKPYPCILCGKRFAHKALLLRHERTHVSGNPVCSDCDFPESNNAQAETETLASAPHGHEVKAENDNAGLSSDNSSALKNITRDLDSANRQQVLNPGTAVCVKVEPVSDLPHWESSGTVHTSSKHKEEPKSHQDGDVTINGIHNHLAPTPFDVTHIKEELSSYEGDPTYSNMFPPTGHRQDISTDVKEEPVEGSHVDISPATKQTQSASPDIKEEPYSHHGEPPRPCLSKNSKEGDSKMKRTSAKNKEEPHLHGDEKHTSNVISGSTATLKIDGGILPNLAEESKDMKLTTPPSDTSKTGYSCPVCQRTFRNHGNLVKHREAHKGKKPTCSICWDQFSSQSELSLHKIKSHKSLTVLLKPKKSHCLTCGATFSSKSGLLKHRKVHKANTRCYECGKTFANKSQLAIHQWIHADGKPFACSECGCGFSTKSNLKEHIKHHTGEKQFPCMHCGKLFTNKNDLTIHKLKHCTSKSFCCSVCGKAFLSRAHFIKHQKFHVSTKPYSCYTCGIGFSHYSGLFRHKKRYTDGSCSKNANNDQVRHLRINFGDEPFHCVDCRKVFTTRRAFKNHQQVHSTKMPFKCSDCEKCFRKRGDLIAHRRTHSGERPFTCDNCGKGFTTKQSRNAHQKIHMVRRQLSCTRCAQTFPYKTQLMDHIRSHENVRSHSGMNAYKEEIKTDGQ